MWPLPLSLQRKLASRHLPLACWVTVAMLPVGLGCNILLWFPVSVGGRGTEPSDPLILADHPSLVLILLRVRYA